MSRFGTSETMVFGTQGPVKLGTKTDETCTTCEFSSSGPHKFAIYREDSRSVTLMCPNCGETKTVFPNEVQRTKDVLTQAAEEEAAQLALLVQKQHTNKKQTTHSTSKGSTKKKRKPNSK